MYILEHVLERMMGVYALKTETSGNLKLSAVNEAVSEILVV